MALSNIGGLLEKRRLALLEYCIGQFGAQTYDFLETPDDLFELLRMDPLDTYPVQSSWVAEATSCAQQYIHAVYRKLEPGYTTHQFDPRHLAEWELTNNYPDWAAVQLIACYPENFINPFVRQRKTSLFKTLESALTQSRLSNDSAQAALRDYLQTFEQTCNLDVISGYMNGKTPARADYYFVGRQREQPFQYFWRKVEVELTSMDKAINPAAWSEWQSVDIPAGNRVLDIRPVFWNGRLCLVWAEWRDRVPLKKADEYIPYKLEINLAFMTQNGQWSAPLAVHSAEYEEDLSAGARLIATVRENYLHPKGKLGVLITNDKTGDDDKLSAQVIRDVLMQPVTDDGGAWLESALQHRFVSAETVQHPIGSQVTVVSRVTTLGAMTPYLDVQFTALRVDGKDVLTVQGFCRPTGLGDGDATMKLALNFRTEDDPADVVQTFSIAGGWTTDVLTYSRRAGSWGATTFSFGDAAGKLGGKAFDLTIVDLMDFSAPTLVKNSIDAAQFLSLNQPGLALKFSRLNSLFAPELVQRAGISVDAVLDWDTQFLSEPPPTGVVFTEPNGAFDGANGLFFWELFFHLPHLMATRMRDEERFGEAQVWLHYLFDPQAVADPQTPAKLVNPKPRYWRCRPLADLGNPGFEAMAPTDPDAIGYAAPEHFKVLVFSDYVRNLMAWGDWYYRQLTRDSLVAAKLCYVQAGFLMGKAPTARTVTRWQTATVESLLTQCGARTALDEFEQTLDYSLADLPAASDTPPILGVVGCGPFEIPINQSLLDLFAAPQQRLDNLRNNLTLDGKPLDIPLFSPPTDPNQLLRDLAAGGVAGPRPMGGRLVVNAFRWRVIFEVALRAVQSLQDYGSQVLNLLERRDRAEQEETQQSHIVELGAYARSMQEQSIAQLEANVTALQQSSLVASERAEAYNKRYVENISQYEYEVMDNLATAKVLAVTSSSIKPAAALMAALPNIFGFANGGHRADQVLEAVSFGLGIASNMKQLDADRQATTEAYRRRRNEWALQRDQALAEVRAIDAQIVAQGYAITAARLNLEQTLRANDQALTVYNFLKKRASNAELYGWLLGQLKALHYQAYDAVISLCLNAQASLSAETGDYDAQIPLPNVWLDHRHGLTAGEHLRGHLLRMEREYLQRHERRLELVKTVSLRQLFEDRVDLQTGADGWASALKILRESGTLEFKLTQLLFDRDHPGHYCRQISGVEVDLPVLTGPYEDVRATLLQIGSMTATRATAQSVAYLHKPTGTAPSDVLFNLRSGQQIALSTGLADNGLTAMKPDEGLLNPFENTGVVSSWKISFPWPLKSPQAATLNSLTDIILRIRYTAKAGERTFARTVEDMVTKAERTGQNTMLKGVRNHE